MLYESPPFYLINGVSILPDHADPQQFYYMPLAPRFVTRRDGQIDVPQLLLIKFQSATQTGGFADFDVHLGLTPDELDEIRHELQRLARLTDVPNLAPVPVVDGSVKLMLFGRMSGDAPADGDNGFVKQIRHSAKPALYGDNRAAFSVELDQSGITILDQAMRGEMAPIGVVYSLDYLALRPAYHVSLRIHWDRVQDFLDQQYGQEGLFTSIQIQDTVDKLIERRDIEFEADTFVPDDEGGTLTERRDAAVARVRDMITDAFFESSLDPLRTAPDGWDKAAQLIKSFSPQRIASPVGVFSYRKTHYTRIDSKRLDVDFSERVTIKRSIYPQGHLSGLFRAFGQGLDPARLVIEAGIGDPWFQHRKLRVISHANPDDGVRSVTATLTYGDDTRQVQLDGENPQKEIDWPSVIENGRMLMPVRMRYQVELLPADGGERPSRLESGDIEVLGDAIGIEPRDLFSLETISVLTLDTFPFDRFPRVDVRLRYDDPAHGIRQDDVVHLGADRKNADWKRFLIGAPAGPVMAKRVYLGADHQRHETPFEPLAASQVDVDDPFPRRLRVDVVSALDFQTVDRAFVDIVYEDTRNGIKVEDSIELTADKPARPFFVDRVDQTLNRVRYKLTVLMKDTTLFEGPWSTTLGKRIFVRSDLRGHRAVVLRAPDDFVAVKLERITVEARSKDELAGLAFADRFDFTGPGSTATFEFDFVDPAADAYELKIRRLFRNGMSSDADWQRFDTDEVTA
ncbi:MAG: hypothetical protein QM766_09095 [Burkholderiaceae bacterium]